MTGPEVKAALEINKAKQYALIKEHETLQYANIKLTQQCPHSERRPYKACGVETNVCIFCGHEVHVRDYSFNSDGD